MNANTQTCRPNWVQRFLDGGLEATELTEFEKHLDQCQHCSDALTQATAGEAFWRDTCLFLTPNADPTSRTGAMVAGHLDTPGPNSPDQETALREETDEASKSLAQELELLLDATDDPRMLGRFAGYEIAGVIGRGGMGLVLKGWDVSLDRFVAIKVLNPIYAGSSAPRQRFAREAQAAASVVHDNVVAIYGVSQWHGTPFLVMPYIKSESLQQRIDRAAPLSVETTLEIALQIARGLAVAHEQGLVHRDIKPSNVLMPSSVSRVQITDFGLARAAGDASLTQSGLIAGTPQYMSPEQARGDTVDERTDQFSLGSVVYAMITGHPPFRADTTYGTLRRITDQRHRRLSQVQPTIPRWLDDIVDRLLQKKPAQRFGSTTALVEHLEDCLAHVRQPATSVLPRLRPARVPRVRATWWTLVTIVLATGVGWGSKSWWSHANRPTESIASETTTAVKAELPTWKFDELDLIKVEHELSSLADEIGDDAWNFRDEKFPDEEGP